MNLVLDVSAAVTLLVDKNKAASIRKALENADFVFVPELFTFEVTNVVWKLMRFQKLPKLACENFLDDILEIPDEFISGAILHTLAFKLATELGRSAYDMFYLALALHESASLLTLDKKLAGLAAKIGISVV